MHFASTITRKCQVYLTIYIRKTKMKQQKDKRYLCWKWEIRDIPFSLHQDEGKKAIYAWSNFWLWFNIRELSFRNIFILCKLYFRFLRKLYLLTLQNIILCICFKFIRFLIYDFSNISFSEEKIILKLERRLKWYSLSSKQVIF